MSLPPRLQAERYALLRVLDNGWSACPDCVTRGVLITWMADLERWHVSPEHDPACVVPRRAPARRAYARWLADELAVMGVRVAEYASVDDLDVTHRRAGSPA